jgi:hypothetical protein
MSKKGERGPAKRRRKSAKQQRKAVERGDFAWRWVRPDAKKGEHRNDRQDK